MLTFPTYSALFGFTLLFPPIAFCVGYFKEPPGHREVTYGSAFMMLVLCVIPIVNIFMAHLFVTSAFEVLCRNLSGRTLLSDKGKK